MVLWLAACLRSIPPELELDPPAARAPAPEPTEPAALRAWLLGGDPLARRVRRPTAPPDPGYAPFLALAPDAGPAELWKVEAEGAGTASRALARGGRLAAAETALGDSARLVRWLTPLAEPGEVKVPNLRPPLDWLGVTSGEAVLPVMERAVLLGWVDGPSVDGTAAAALLSDPTWARLAPTPAGRVLRARGVGPPAAPAAVEALQLATVLALAEVAADRPDEHEAVRSRRAALGVGASGDGVAELLTRALEGLADAGPDADVGRALTAHAALRWRGRCPDAPCGGFDRLPELAAGARFGAGPEAAVWRVVMWKAATDELWAAWDHAEAPRAMDRVVELVTERNPRVLDLTALARPSPDAGWVLPVTRALGGPEGTSKDALFRVLNARVAAEAEAAAAVAPAYADTLGRIARRSARAAK